MALTVIGKEVTFLITSGEKHDDEDTHDVDANNNVKVVNDLGVRVAGLGSKGLFEVYEGLS